MPYLAQVTKKESLGTAGLRLLACQKSETTWAIVSEEKIVPCVEADSMSEGLLVLVEFCENNEVKIGNACQWVLYLVQQYLITGVTPEFLQAEAERAEQWRQELTLKSQDVGRKVLEVEARREQIQELEATLKGDRQELDAMEAQLKVKEAQLTVRSEDLDAVEAELKFKEASVDSYREGTGCKRSSVTC